MSFLFPILKQPKARQFNHQPIYYDKLKDERQQRYERIRKEMNMEQDPNMQESTSGRDFEKSIRGSFRKAVPGGSKIETVTKISRTVSIVCIVLIVVLVIVYFFIR